MGNEIEKYSSVESILASHQIIAAVQSAVRTVLSPNLYVLTLFRLVRIQRVLFLDYPITTLLRVFWLIS